MFTFAIESSCDETSAAILDNFEVRSNIILSQLFHKDYGGIVPELASRAHIKTIDKIVKSSFDEANLSELDIGLVAATRGPGLIGSLLVGFNFAKGFAASNNIPFIGIDHIESHLFSCFIGKAEIEFPFISLVVSGGHTILFLVCGYNDYKVLGQTQDDAAGEAFDKVAKMLGLEYPGGPLIDKLAKVGNEDYHKFPEAEIKGSPYDFSFSGIKTSVLYYLRKNFPGDTLKIPLNDLCASFQKAVVGSLVSKTISAAKNYGIKNIAVSGGVSANSRLRNEFMKCTSNGYNVFFPEKIYSTDNAAMIGYTAYLKYIHSPAGSFDNEILKQAFARFGS
ncbi:MAG: tRNA (adenosine(37)-N6)-threonylcarbamoyltransferase complex transferase subunit TsaD [Ignavibacteria bacterium]|nr:tRNA (adenosine(37)-N6)-threonylcarbamoyltransferase complex transferase subunit TsaD [Ignavibacteria bacterium]MCC7158886.1 tRNA (adenosine(37)-N6)-threonylcarbamoyltransferase complex transferase subunit TsaD [Ignavibacteria bacterium]